MKLLGAVAGVAAAVAVAAPAQALSNYGDVVAEWESPRAVIANDANGNGGGVFRFLRHNGDPGDNFAGVLVGGNSPEDNFIGVCIELGEFVDAAKSTFTIRDVADSPIDSVSVMGPQRAADVAKLVTLAFNGRLANALNTGAPVLAFQIALWEISTDRVNVPGSYSLTDMLSSYTHPVVSGAGLQAKQWLDKLNFEFLNATSLQTVLARNLFALTNGGDPQNDDRQDMLVQTPIPAAAWLLGSGLLGLFGISRRRQVAAA
jgi:hypothetical protein